jgi:hypothetical protein
LDIDEGRMIMVRTNTSWRHQATHRRWFSAAVAVAVTLAGATAQQKTGSTVGQFLLIEPSARASAMGNAGAALHDEALAGYYNPAAWGHLSGTDAQVMHSAWLAGIAFDYGAVGVPVGGGSTVAITLASLNSGEIAVRTVQQPLGTGEYYRASSLALGVGYAIRVTDRFSAGLHLHYVQETIWHSSLTAFSIDVGTLYQLTPDGLTLGASLSNFGTKGRYSGSDLRIRFDNDASVYGDNSNLPAEVYTEEFSLPILFRVGLAYPALHSEHHRLIVAVDAVHPSDNTESVSFGAEWTFDGFVSLRGGYQQLFKQDSEVGLTLGGGIAYEVFGWMVRIDYAWADHGRLQDTQRFTVGFLF